MVVWVHAFLLLTTLTLLISPILSLKENLFWKGNTFWTKLVVMFLRRALGDDSEAIKFCRIRQWMTLPGKKPTLHMFSLYFFSRLSPRIFIVNEFVSCSFKIYLSRRMVGSFLHLLYLCYSFLTHLLACL